MTPLFPRLVRLRERVLDLMRREDGAVTIDWVVLTAGIVVLGVLAAGGLSVSISDASDTIAETITSANSFLD
ncbi:hypothetical protein GVY41_09635 [Frigidibacter albus]|uniref:Pilus assembly protein n=1 Tax=Frigidibacter albus TaxID=1465486 RepID=A0A6L8VJ64_9RHOB|nr:hypothetical protein [Frigidibacter albus]MZQ89349.1 hypothetical protein [Frigidibacter albus]NBE31255.1 hypothetical protein [Frigidibacter albus]GGH53733.1 hypothetical protein GCM10011341_19460 [Frigidibacter albus]